MVKLKSNISFKKPKLKQILIPLTAIVLVTTATGGFFIYKNIKQTKQVASAPKLLTENKEPTNDSESKTTEQVNSQQLTDNKNQEKKPAEQANTPVQVDQSKTTIQSVASSALVKPPTSSSAPKAPSSAPKTLSLPSTPVNTTTITNPNQIYSVAAAQNYVENQVFKLVNAERARVGVAQLGYNQLLGNAAEIRVSEEAILSFAGTDHVRPNGTSFSTVFPQVGYRYHYCGENLIWGYQSPFVFNTSNLNILAAKIFNGWKNSPGHYANMISTNYKETGLGIRLINSSGRLYYFGIQEFGSR